MQRLNPGTSRGVVRCVVWWTLSAVIVAFGAFAAGADGPEVPDVAGRWLMIQELSTIADIPFLGEVRLTTTVGLFIDIVQDGTVLTMQDAYCFTDVELSTDLFVTDVPDAVMRAICPEPRTATLVEVDDRWHLIQDWHTEVRGAELDDPANDPLPTYRSDPRLVDLDGDGHPGITLPAEILGLLSGETYAVQRFRYRLYGSFIDDRLVVGLLDWTTEQRILDASDALMMMPFEEHNDPDPKAHRFAMLRVDPYWTCDEIRTQLPVLRRFLDLI